MQSNHLFQGMRRDNHPIRQDKNFLWDALNIRLTARDGNTMMSLTNEKSTKPLYTFTQGEEYIGHTVIGDYLILLVHLSEGDCIYRIDLSKEDKYPVILFKGNLNFDPKFPAQVISDFESELIQKVYWVDGKNPPRVINIAKPELLSAAYNMTLNSKEAGYSETYKDEPFDFVQKLELKEEVEAKRLLDGNGVFPAGVIQYAFTYYNKYGQESNIFHTTELLYISHSDRGGSPEDNISTAFSLKIDNIDDRFQYLRIYSILRTSIDATPTVKRVTDIEISNKSITYIDNGTTGDIVDPTMLLYIGGKDIIANCITSKDNTLFLGDIKYRRQELSSISIIGKIKKSLEDSIECDTREEKLIKPKTDKDPLKYSYDTQLIKNTSTFKVGETYRLGVQFQYETGEWSEPLYIKDDIMQDVRPSVSDNELNLPIFKINGGKTIDSENFTKLKDNGYIKVRPIIVLPSTKDKTILAQGILCPTVFNYGARDSNTPFAQSSWFLRPFLTKDPTDETFPQLNTAIDASKGALAEFRHYAPLITGASRGAEIQNMFIDTGVTEAVDTEKKGLNFIPSLNDANSDVNTYRAMYYVDQSILTFHSPDIEFNDQIPLAIDNNPNISVRLVGVVPFNSNYGDINIQESSVVIDPEGAGFIHRSISNNNDGGRSLISGLFYEDAFADEERDTTNFRKEGSLVPWMVHLWHRSGSLNNDCVRPDGAGARSAVLKKKVISNIKLSNKVDWLVKPESIKNSTLQVFNSNEVSLLKIKDDKNKSGDITYYGNVDSINSSYKRFRLLHGKGGTREITPSKISQLFGIIKVPMPDGTPQEQDISVSVDSLKGNILTGVEGTITSDTVIKVWDTIVNEITGDTSKGLVSKNIKGSLLRDLIIQVGVQENQPFTSKIVVDDITYTFEGNTSVQLKYKNVEATAFNFSEILDTVDPSPDLIGDTYAALKLPKDPVRIKYKSTPHVVFATKYKKVKDEDKDEEYRIPLPVLKGTALFNNLEHKAPKVKDIYWYNLPPKSEELIKPIEISLDSIKEGYVCPSAYLWLAEIYQNVDAGTRYGGTSPEALMNNLWIPAGPAVRIDELISDNNTKNIEWHWGDTWYQRYDCLKTYPFTNEDENQVVEIGSFMCETRVNIEGRYDRNKGNVSNLHASPTNFNLINPVYSQMNTFFNYRKLDSDYYKVDSYPSQLMWTGVKSPSAIQDAWTNLHMASTLDLDGTNGKLIAIQPFNDLLIGFQEKAVQQILFNSRVQIQATDGVPIEIASSQKVEGTRPYSNSIGCQDKFNIVSTPLGIYFIDNNSHSIYKFNGELNNIGLQLGTLYWARENYQPDNWCLNDKTGIRLYYDTHYQDVYFTPANTEAEEVINNTLCFSEQLGQFTSMMSYNGAVMFSYTDKFYSLAKDKEDKLVLWANFEGDGHNKIFGKDQPFEFSFVSNDNPTLTKIFDNIEMRVDSYDGGSISDTDYIGRENSKDTFIKPFDYIEVKNEYQKAKHIFTDATLRKKFRVWRGVIPRNEGTRERIRNPWTIITLGGVSKNGRDLTILHDIAVNYTV